jgi:hypothetical protein
MQHSTVYCTNIMKIDDGIPNNNTNRTKEYVIAHESESSLFRPKWGRKEPSIDTQVNKETKG